MAGDVKVAVVHGQIGSGSAGTADFTEVGFGTPKACIILMGSSDIDTGIQNGGAASIGFSDFLSDFCISHQDEHASAKVDNDARKSNTKAYVILGATGSVRTDGGASTITDGVRLSNTTHDGGARHFATVIMFGGADTVDDLRSTGIGSAINETATITHAGLTDGNEKLIFFIGLDISGEDATSTGINNSFGVCHISGNDAGGYTFVQRAIGWASDHNATEGAPSAIISTDRVLDIIAEDGTQDWGLEVTAFSSSGGTITVTTRDKAAGGGMEVYSLIIDLDDRKAAVQTNTLPTSGATRVVTGFGFKPQYVGEALTDLTSLDTINTGAEAGVFGISSNAGAGNESCHSWYNEDNSAITNTANIFSSNVVDLFNDDTATQLQDHSHLSFDSGGFTTTINTENATVAKQTFSWAIEEAAAGAIVVNIGLALETDTAFGMSFAPRRLVGLALETDTAFPIRAVRIIPIGLATETDIAFAFSIPKIVTIGQASAVNTAFPVPFELRRLVALALETDSAFAFLHPKGLNLLQALETDTAFAMTFDLRRLAAQALETDTAFPMTFELRRLVTQALETDTALPMAVELRRLVALALETDTAFAMTFDLRRLAAQALETDTAFPMPFELRRLVALALETDTAFVITPFLASGGVVPIGLATETNTAFPVTFDLRRLVALAIETDTAFVMTPSLASGGPVGGIYPRLRRRRRS